MLSYQHSYHAGNAADVHKHVALLLALEHLRKKDKPFTVVDPTAGRGLYDLTSPEAQKTGEFKDGIAKIMAQADPPPAVTAYVEAVRTLNTDDTLTAYPGSPLLALTAMRPDDRLIALELHPQEHAALKRTLRNDPRAAVHKRDLYEGLPALTPPPIKRGLVLIDPSYEVKDEYARLPGLIDKVFKHWSAAVVLVWYPLLPEGRHASLIKGLKALGQEGFAAELTWRKATEERGMYGTGLAALNPPWKLDEDLSAAGDWLATILGDGAHTLTAF